MCVLQWRQRRRRSTQAARSVAHNPTNKVWTRKRRQNIQLKKTSQFKNFKIKFSHQLIIYLMIAIELFFYHTVEKCVKQQNIHSHAIYLLLWNTQSSFVFVWLGGSEKITMTRNR